ncbi:MAG: phosphopantothenoylcysteine decarboxylase [Candidatus Omnitrophota bacterium]
MPRSRKRHILVTLGPTWEFIDPIRFITNRATGTLGYQIAQEGLRRGHRLTCVAGPTTLTPLSGVRWIPVVSAEEMYRAVAAVFPKADALVMTAAVSDYRAAKRFPAKLKRRSRQIFLPLVQNRDVLKEMSQRRRHQVLVGFALETERVERQALKKLREKELDLLVANVLNYRHDPFGAGPVSGYFLWKDGRCQKVARVSKKRLSRILFDAIEALIASRHIREGKSAR